MRYTVLGVIMGFLFIVFLACNMTISGRSIRQNELEQAVNRAAEQTVERMKAEGSNSIAWEELAAELSENILSSINGDSAIEIRIMECDMEKGILSVQVQESFEHLNGKKGMVLAERTIIWEQYELSPIME